MIIRILLEALLTWAACTRTVSVGRSDTSGRAAGGTSSNSCHHSRRSLKKGFTKELTLFEYSAKVAFVQAHNIITIPCFRCWNGNMGCWLSNSLRTPTAHIIRVHLETADRLRWDSVGSKQQVVKTGVVKDSRLGGPPTQQCD